MSAMNKDQPPSSLQSLHFSKKSTHDDPGSVSPPSTSSKPSLSTPPPQSRDSSGLSHVASPSWEGNVLVPSSSPIQVSPPPSRFPNPIGLQSAVWQPSSAGQYQQSPTTIRASQYRPPPPRVSEQDFMASAMPAQRPPNNLFQRYAYQSTSGDPKAKLEQARAAKAAGVSTPPSSSRNLVASPGSPEVVPAGQRKRKRALADDELSDESTGTKSGRLTRERPAVTMPSTPTRVEDDPAFIKFKMLQPTDTLARIKAAWVESNGDARKASLCLMNAKWIPKVNKPSPPAKTAPKSQSGRIVDTKAEQAKLEMKARQSQSAIYKNRDQLGGNKKPNGDTVLTLQTPVQSPIRTSTIDLTQSSPASIAMLESPMRRPTRKAKKVMVVSDEEEGSDEAMDVSEEEEEEEEQLDTAHSSALTAAAEKTLAYFNDIPAEGLHLQSGITLDMANTIISFRPFVDFDDLTTKLGQGRRKNGPGGISPRLVADTERIMLGYAKVDSILAECEKTGKHLRNILDSWINVGVDAEKLGDTGVGLTRMASLKQEKIKGYISRQPNLAEGVQLKEYQLLGLNWLNLLHTKGHSCILADEMGLGKTIQVISFIQFLKEKGYRGPHLVVVPASTLENWCREFQKFAPSVEVQTYYADKKERPLLQHDLIESQRTEKNTGWEVLITTYQLASTDGDRRFFKKFDWECCVFDEGHMLKNSLSERYKQLMKIKAKWKLLLTGTPLQNNLQELVALMNFILPEFFDSLEEDLKAIFKAKGGSQALLARERITRAKQMLTPFVLRRRKDQVLQELPKKVERVIKCDMNAMQHLIYKDAIQRSKRTIYDIPPGTAASSGQDTPPVDAPPPKKKTKGNPKKEKMYLENSSNVLMDLRKASSHPMLFRRRFTDDTLNAMAKLLIKEPDFRARRARLDYVTEDMSVMTDAELQVYCGQYKCLTKFSQEQTCFEDSGKVQTLLKMLDEYREAGRKVLVFSQFTQILDIIEVILKRREINYLVLTGSTPVDARQSLVDEFGEDESIPVFLLSTKAGGMGINLTAASVVIIFDQDFNPHNDRQAQDRAYRIGQKRDVDVIKLISKGTIEEDMYRLGQTKLALDEAVAGQNDDNDDGGKAEEQMKIGLLQVLRQKFEEEPAAQSTEAAVTTS